MLLAPLLCSGFPGNPVVFPPLRQFFETRPTTGQSPLPAGEEKAGGGENPLGTNSTAKKTKEPAAPKKRRNLWIPFYRPVRSDDDATNAS